MFKKILYLLLTFISLNLSAQTTVYDTLWSENFNDGTFDSFVFTDAVSKFNASLGKGFLYPGESLKLTLPPYTFDSNTDNVFLGFKLKLNATIVYDSIKIFTRLSGYNYNAIPNLKYVDNSVNPPITYTSDISNSGNYTASWVSQKICINCNSIDFNSTLNFWVNGMYNLMLNKINSNFLYKKDLYKSYDLSKSYNSMLFDDMTDDFCNECSQDEFYKLRNGFSSTQARFLDCKQQVIPLQYSDIVPHVFIKYVDVIGYRQNTTTNIEVENISNVNDIVAIYDLSGKILSLNNSNIPEIFIAQYSKGNRKLMTKDLFESIK